MAPDCAPLFLTDGFRESMTALLTHYGYWVQPSRRQDKGPHPKPHWMPLSPLLYAQVVKQCRVGSPGLPDQHRVHRAAEPHHPPTCGRGRATGQHAVQTRSGLAPATGVVSRLSQLLSAPCQPPPASLTAPAHPGPWLGQNVATADTGHGRGADRSRLDAARGAPVSRAAVAPASGGMSTP